MANMYSRFSARAAAIVALLCALAAGRAVLETGEFDYAWNLQLAPDVIGPMEAEGGQGTVVAGFGPLVERLEMNMTNPSPDLPHLQAKTLCKMCNTSPKSLRTACALVAAYARASLPLTTSKW